MIQSDKKLIIVVVISCILLALLGFAWKQRTSIPFVTVTLEGITTPFAYGSARLLEGVQTSFTVLNKAISSTIESEAEASRKAALEQKVVNYDEVVAENIRLRQLLNYKSNHPGTWTNTFTIDKGSEEGMAVNMAVVVPSGVVGFITDVYPHSARVQTILDPRSAVGILVQRPESRLSGVVKGNGNTPRTPSMVNIARDGDVLVGDKLITSGYGGIYPKGLPVGNVQSIENDTEGFVKNAVVTPSVDFHRIEEVFVLTSSSLSAPQKPELEPKLVPQTQRDQVEGVKGVVKQ